MDISDGELIKFRIAGSEFNKDDGYNLKYVLDSLSVVESVIEKTYTYVQGKERFTKADEDNMKVKLAEVSEGSFRADLVIFLQNVALPLAPMFTFQDPKEMWGLAVSCFKYLKQVFKAKEKGEKLQMEVRDNDNSVVIINTGNGDVTAYPAIVPALAKDLSPYFTRLGNMVTEDGKVSSISVGSNGSEKDDKIELDVQNKNLFKKRNYLDDEIITVEGVIFKIDVDKYTGTLNIYDGIDNIKPGKYNFSFIDPDSIDINEIRESLKSFRTFRCMKSIRFNPANMTEEVIELKIVSIKHRDAAW